jgi:hypothetical protein
MSFISIVAKTDVQTEYHQWQCEGEELRVQQARKTSHEPGVPSQPLKLVSIGSVPTAVYPANETTNYSVKSTQSNEIRSGKVRARSKNCAQSQRQSGRPYGGETYR